MGGRAAGLIEDGEREKREGQEDDPHALLDREVEENRWRAEVKQEAERSNAGAQEPSAEGKYRRGKGKEPNHRLDPKVGLFRTHLNRCDDVTNEHVSDRIERVGVCEGI